MWEPATFEKMVEGVARAPFQFRALIPWTVDFLRNSVGLSQPGLEQFRFGSEFLFTFLLLIAFRAYVSCFLSGPVAPSLATLLLAWVLPFHYLIPQRLGLYYVYDVPSVFFFTLGLLFLYRRRWLLFYPLFLVATFNRETTCFLTLIYLMTALPRGRRETRGQSTRRTEHSLPVVAAHCAAQLAIWYSIKYALHSLYGGSLHYTHYTRNFYLLRVPATYPILLSVFGFAWVPVLLGLRRIENAFVRRACFAVPIFFLGIFIVAQICELRLYGEMIPIVLAAFICVLLKTAGEVTLADY